VNALMSGLRDYGRRLKWWVANAPAVATSSGTVTANGIEIAYEEFGSRRDPAVVMVMGLGTQLIGWPDALCHALVHAGYRVVRFDNRDVGLSTKFDGRSGLHDMNLALAHSILGMPISAPYTLFDMAADAVGLVDALGIEKAHFVGSSMGGMIAQIVASTRPQRTRSLVSIMSTSGYKGLPAAKPAALHAIVAPRPSIHHRDRAIKHAMEIHRTIGSSRFPISDEDLRDRAGRYFDRCYYPEGVSRHVLAILASGDRVEALKRIQAPTLVIHGSEDPLVPVEAGKHTASLVPGSQLLVIEGMGHDYPSEVVPVIADRIIQHCREADGH
jgi:pimeloyl-ACP methyl ester carboxylesterase